MSNKYAKEKIQIIAEELEKALKEKECKYSKTELDELQTVCQKLYTFCGKAYGLEYKRRVEKEESDKKYNDNIKRVEKKIEENKKKMKKLLPIESKAKQEEYDNLKRECERNELSIGILNTLRKCAEALTPKVSGDVEFIFKDYMTEGKNKGKAFNGELKALAIKNITITNCISEMIKSGEIESWKYYDGEQGETNLKNDIDNMLYKSSEKTYKNEDKTKLWNAMLIAFKRCAEETGLIQMNLSPEPEEFFKEICLYFYAFESAEKLPLTIQNEMDKKLGKK